MNVLTNLSVRHKITAITLFTILVVSLLSSIVYVVVEGGRARDAVVKEMKTIAGIVADNSTAALVFNDPASADETLSALKAEPDIIGAAIFRNDGSLFATYTVMYPQGWPRDQADAKERQLIAAKSVAAPASGTATEQVRFRDELLEVMAPIRLDGEVIGNIVLRSSLDSITSALWTYILIVSGRDAGLLGTGLRPGLAPAGRDLHTDRAFVDDHEAGFRRPGLFAAGGNPMARTNSAG